jgi:hypothetical protein
MTSLSMKRSSESIRRAIDASLTARMTVRERDSHWLPEVLARSFWRRGWEPGHDHCQILLTDRGRIWVKTGHRRAAWNVPPECPVCCASVAQAVRTTDPNPICDFCHNPLRVAPS